MDIEGLVLAHNECERARRKELERDELIGNEEWLAEYQAKGLYTKEVAKVGQAFDRMVADRKIVSSSMEGVRYEPIPVGERRLELFDGEHLLPIAVEPIKARMNYYNEAVSYTLRAFVPGSEYGGPYFFQNYGIIELEPQTVAPWSDGSRAAFENLQEFAQLLNEVAGYAAAESPTTA